MALGREPLEHCWTSLVFFPTWPQRRNFSSFALLDSSIGLLRMEAKPDLLGLPEPGQCLNSSKEGKHSFGPETAF